MSAEITSALGDIFGNEDIASTAIYTPADAGVSTTVRVIVRAADMRTPVFGTNVTANTVIVEVRCSEVTEPIEGDLIQISGEDRIIQGQPRRDAMRLIWTLDTRPA